MGGEHTAGLPGRDPAGGEVHMAVDESGKNGEAGQGPSRQAAVGPGQLVAAERPHVGQHAVTEGDFTVVDRPSAEPVDHSHMGEPLPARARRARFDARRHQLSPCGGGAAKAASR